MKDVELKLVSELMKNSRRSDRELAQVLGVSQPTVSRTIKKLEKQGYLREYTIIPDFHKLGYHLFVLTFFKWKKGLSSKEMKEAREWGEEKASAILNAIVIERGIGIKYDSFMGSFHKNYTAYTKFITEIKKSPYLDKNEILSFIVDLDDKTQYRYLTFTTLAKHLLGIQKEKTWD
jgi:DNA-binding Lrp family transcriptional regulator